MIEREGRHFTTEVFLAMHGHDISVAHPLESQIIADARELLGDKYNIEQTDLEGFWKEAQKHLDREHLPVLTGERRSYLKEGMWTFLFPGTISARTYLKQMDFSASNALVYYAEPLASLASALGAAYPAGYMERDGGIYCPTIPMMLTEAVRRTTSAPIWSTDTGKPATSGIS